MPTPFDPVAFLELFDAPAAWCDSAGTVIACNDHFATWAGPAVGARVEAQGGRGALLVEGRAARPLVMTPIATGGWLAVPATGDGLGAVAAVAAAVARRLEGVEASLEANAQMGLLEQPSEAVAHCLRETLAVSEELRTLRRQVAALGTPAPAERLPVCLEHLLRDVIGALPGVPVALESIDGDYTVEVNRAALFPALVGLVQELGAGASVAAPLGAQLRGGDHVRMRFYGAALPTAPTSAIEAARALFVAGGGRVLLEPGAALTLELPAFARGLGTHIGVGTVLIVDDDESALAMMGAVLRRAGFRILAAENGVTASMLLRQHLDEIVAIVADAVLPGRSGVELVAEARRSVPGLPVLLVSGHSSDLLGASDLDDLPILSKPFGAHALADRVRRMLDPSLPPRG